MALERSGARSRASRTGQLQDLPFRRHHTITVYISMIVLSTPRCVGMPVGPGLVGLMVSKRRLGFAVRSERNPVLGAMPLSLGDRRVLLAIRDVLEKLPDGDIEEVTKSVQYRGVKPRHSAVPIGVRRFGVKLALFHEGVRRLDAGPLGNLTDEDFYHPHILPIPQLSQNARKARLRTMPNIRVADRHYLHFSKQSDIR